VKKGDDRVRVVQVPAEPRLDTKGVKP
jgi:hypothetical protein